MVDIFCAPCSGKFWILHLIQTAARKTTKYFEYQLLSKTWESSLFWSFCNICTWLSDQCNNYRKYNGSEPFRFAGDNVRGWPTCSWGCNFNGYPRTLVPHKQWWRHINLIICRKHFKSVFYMFELKTSLRRIPIFCLYWRIG